MTNKLTDKQTLFIELLFTDEYVNNPKGAALVAGYSSSMANHVSVILNSPNIKEEILRRIDEYLVINAPKSVFNILNVMDNPNQAGAKARLDAAAAVLDRAGITKKERVEVEHKVASGVFLLPAKQST